MRFDQQLPVRAVRLNRRRNDPLFMSEYFLHAIRIDQFRLLGRAPGGTEEIVK
jgi:hypothetical protein